MPIAYSKVELIFFEMGFLKFDRDEYFAWSSCHTKSQILEKINRDLHFLITHEKDSFLLKDNKSTFKKIHTALENLK